MGALEGAYGLALKGLPGAESIDELVASYQAGPGDARAQAERLVRWQVTKAATTGFVTGLGGLITMPVTIPTNIAAVLFIQSRMVAAVAALAGHDPRSDQVRTLVFACMAGKSAVDLLKGSGALLGEKLAIQALKQVPGKTLVAINQKVGFRLVTKFGQTGVVNLGKALPLVGGVIGGTFDGVTTATVGKIAVRLFHDPAKEPEPTEAH